MKLQSYFSQVMTVILGVSVCFSVMSLDKLPVPESLISLETIEGQSLFNKSKQASFWKLMPYFVTQETLTYCGIASATMVLNASNIPAPVTPQLAPYRIFDQHNFFTPQVLNVITPTKVGMEGATLKELGAAIATFPVTVKTVYGSEISEEDFREEAISVIQSTDHFMILNFHRKYIGEAGEGHFSPIAAYDKKTDRFLLLDVSRYKYPVVWVETSALYQAMRLNDHGEVERIRGYLVVSS